MHAPSYRELLAASDVRALLSAAFLSRLAGRMFTLTIVLYALARIGSPVLAGWLAFSAVAPGLLVSPVAGALIDRVGSVWAIAVDMTASVACAAALIAADHVGWASAPVLLVLTGLFSVTSPLSMAGIRALLPRLVPMTAWDRVNAVDTAINGLTDTVGPALAGALVGFRGPVSALATIALTYAAAALCTVTIHRPRGRYPAMGPLLVQAWHGVSRVVRQPTLRGLAVAYSLYDVCWGILVVIVPVFAARNFVGGGGSAVAGLLWAGLGLVGGTAALIAGRRHIAGRERQVMAVGMLVTAVAAWPVAAEFGLPGLVVGLVMIGGSAGPIDVGALTLRQRRTDPAELGRIVSVSMSLNLSGGPLGSAFAGMLVTRSLTATFVAAALASVLAAAAVALIPGQDRD